MLMADLAAAAEGWATFGFPNVDSTNACRAWEQELDTSAKPSFNGDQSWIENQKERSKNIPIMQATGASGIR
jgi:hypothetical protein